MLIFTEKSLIYKEHLVTFAIWVIMGYFMSWGVSPILHLLYTARCKLNVKQVSNRCELGVKVDFEV